MEKMSVLITRPKAQGEELARFLVEGLEKGRLAKERLEAEILFQPAIEILPPEDDYAAVDENLRNLERFDWCVFSSVNGVEAFVRRFENARLERSACRVKMAAIGAGTQKALEDAGWGVDFVPEVFRAEYLALGLVGEAKRKASFWLLRASRGREVLAEILEQNGAHVSQTIAYRSVDVTRESSVWDAKILEKMERGEILWTTITSSAIARATVGLFGEALLKTRLVSISPLTSEELERHGFSPYAEAREATMEGVAQAILSRL
ncbi:MAG: uroporphyrinogen-III synthase [Planctomycetia bacterium]|nr:uroporphyrinogen-III synthase [Planctomycetia bacterium]